MPKEEQKLSIGQMVKTPNGIGRYHGVYGTSDGKTFALVSHKKEDLKIDDNTVECVHIGKGADPRWDLWAYGFEQVKG